MNTVCINEKEYIEKEEALKLYRSLIVRTNFINSQQKFMILYAEYLTDLKQLRPLSMELFQEEVEADLIEFGVSNHEANNVVNDLYFV